MRDIAIVVAFVVALTGISATPAAAVWQADASGTGTTSSLSMTSGNRPSAAARPSNGNSIEVSWASSVGGPVAGYEVRAYDAGTGASRPVGGSCAGLVATTSCNDTGVPDGNWQYTVTPRQETWTGTESARSTAVVVDTAAPTTALIYPTSGAIYNSTTWGQGCSVPGFCGTASDVGSGVISGGVILQQVETGLFWTGAAFASTVPVLIPITSGNGAYSEWAFPVANFPTDGVYTVRVSATDAVGNTSTASATFTIDREGPAVPRGFPDPGGTYGVDLWNAGCATPGFCGSEEDVGTGDEIVGADYAVLQDATGRYWDGTAFTSTSETMHPVTTPDGSIPFPIGNFPVDGAYTVHADVRDAAGNTTRTTTPFTIDRVMPTITPLFPVPGGVYDDGAWNAGCPAFAQLDPTFSQAGICGVGEDDNGDISSALLSVRQASTGLYWDGDSFSSPTESFFDITGVGLLPFPASNFPDDGSYFVRAVVRDLGGNVASIADTFTMDDTAPSVSITHPRPAAVYTAATWSAGCARPGVCGAVADATSGLASGGISVRRDATGLYWNGTSFSSSSEVFLTTTADSFAFPASYFPADGAYTVRIDAPDFAGNRTTVAVPFVYQSVAAGRVCNGPLTFTNGGFEQPVIPPANVRQLTAAEVPGWESSTDRIELWGSGVEGRIAAEGTQLAELNSTGPSTYYQDVATAPGASLVYNLWHRGRFGTDTASVQLGTPGATPTQSRNIVTGNTAWVAYTGGYVVPAGQTTTRFGIASVSSNGGGTVGNHIDGVQLRPAACLSTTLAAAVDGGGSANPGDTLTYTVTATSAGGATAGGAVAMVALPSGTSLVPGSLRIAGTPRSDATGDDPAELVPDAGTVRFRLGSGATASAGGTLTAGQSTTATFQVRIGATASGTLTTQASATWTDPSIGVQAGLSGVVSTPVVP